MEWIKEIKGKRVFLDTSPFIYFIEESTLYSSLVGPIFQLIHVGDVVAVTSSITLLEVLVRPLRQDDQKLAGKYRDALLNSKNLFTKPISHEISERAAEIRALHKIRTPDAIQLATALVERADFFLTNDMRLPSLGGMTLLVLEKLQK